MELTARLDLYEYGFDCALFFARLTITKSSYSLNVAIKTYALVRIDFTLYVFKENTEQTCVYHIVADDCL